MSKQDERRRLARSRQLREAKMRLAHVIKNGQCLLCGEPADMVGVWETTPEVARQLGTSPGKSKLFAYMVCSECREIPDPATRIEDAILARWERDTANVCPN